jgi:sec-independent protein translocase protein TatA
MQIGPLELTIILAIVILIFGVGRIGRLGSELGTAIRSFREGLNESDTPEKSEQPAGADAKPEDSDAADKAP